MRTASVAVALFLALVPAMGQEVPVPPQPPPAPPKLADTASTAHPPPAERWYLGGGIGFGFGTVEYVDLSPIVGYRISRQVTAGAGLTYRYLRDGRYDPEITTSDWGGSVFGEFHVVPQLFFHAEYEYLNYEVPLVLGGTSRSNASSFLVGVGAGQAVGGRVATYAAVLYNVTYDDTDPNRPYDSPWVFRVGVGVGF